MPSLLELAEDVAELKVEITVKGGNKVFITLTYNPDAFSGALLAEMKAANESGQALSETNVNMLEKLLVKWDVTDNDKKPFPPTKENLMKMPLRIIMPIVEAVSNAVIPNAGSDRN